MSAHPGVFSVVNSMSELNNESNRLMAEFNKAIKSERPLTKGDYANLSLAIDSQITANARIQEALLLIAAKAGCLHNA